nr:type II toxin-antitoxin system RelE/ParE family toxin [Leptospira ilyithenensis]
MKKLKGNFEGIYRYRIGKFRLFYIIKDKELIVIFIDVDLRKDSYK